MGPLVLIVMRSQLPDTARPFRLKGAWVIAFLALWSSSLIVYWTGWDTNWKMFAAILIGFVLLGAQQTFAKRTTPALDLRHDWWLLVWFAGLAVISYLGPYPAVSKGVGNLGVTASASGSGSAPCSRHRGPPAHGGSRLMRQRGGPRRGQDVVCSAVRNFCAMGLAGTPLVCPFSTSTAKAKSPW